MKTKKYIAIAKSLVSARMLDKKIPLAVGWRITNRCNQRCRYCNIWNIRCNELRTKEAFLLLDGLAKMGTQVLSLTGGEPLLRDDIGDIIDYASGKNISMVLNSNGALVEKRIKAIRKVGRIKLSFDGPQGVHDQVRGDGSHEKVMKAIQLSKENGLQVTLSTVLSRYNLDHVRYVLEVARKFNITALFQPATLLVLGGNCPDQVAPSEKELKKVINELIIEKKRGNACIANSIKGLEHLFSWPRPRKLKCMAGRLSFRIEPNGDLRACGSLLSNTKYPNFLIDGLPAAVEKVVPASCDFCWCASVVEFNYVCMFNLDATFNALRSTKVV